MTFLFGAGQVAVGVAVAWILVTWVFTSAEWIGNHKDKAVGWVGVQWQRLLHRLGTKQQ